MRSVAPARAAMPAAAITRSSAPAVPPNAAVIRRSRPSGAQRKPRGASATGRARVCRSRARGRSGRARRASRSPPRCPGGAPLGHLEQPGGGRAGVMDEPRATARSAGSRASACVSARGPRCSLLGPVLRVHARDARRPGRGDHRAQQDVVGRRAREQGREVQDGAPVAVRVDRRPTSVMSRPPPRSSRSGGRP